MKAQSLVGFNASCHWDYVNRQVSAFNCLHGNIEILMMIEKWVRVRSTEINNKNFISSVKAVKNT